MSALAKLPGKKIRLLDKIAWPPKSLDKRGLSAAICAFEGSEDTARIFLLVGNQTTNAPDLGGRQRPISSLK